MAPVCVTLSLGLWSSISAPVVGGRALVVGVGLVIVNVDEMV